MQRFSINRKLFPSNSASVQAHITHSISSCFVCSFEMHFKFQPLFWGTYEYRCYFKEDRLVKPQIKSWLKAVQYHMKLDFTFISLNSFPKHSMAWYEPCQWKRNKQLESEKCTTAAWYSDREKMFSRKYIVQTKEI